MILNDLKLINFALNLKNLTISLIESRYRQIICIGQ